MIFYHRHVYVEGVHAKGSLLYAGATYALLDPMYNALKKII